MTYSEFSRAGKIKKNFTNVATGPAVPGVVKMFTNSY